MNVLDLNPQVYQEYVVAKAEEFLEGALLCLQEGDYENARIWANLAKQALQEWHQE